MTSFQSSTFIPAASTASTDRLINLPNEGDSGFGGSTTDVSTRSPHLDDTQEKRTFEAFWNDTVGCGNDENKSKSLAGDPTSTEHQASGLGGTQINQGVLNGVDHQTQGPLAHQTYENAHPLSGGKLGNGGLPLGPYDYTLQERKSAPQDALACGQADRQDNNWPPITYEDAPTSNNIFTGFPYLAGSGNPSSEGVLRASYLSETTDLPLEVTAQLAREYAERQQRADAAENVSQGLTQTSIYQHERATQENAPPSNQSGFGQPTFQNGETVFNDRRPQFLRETSQDGVSSNYQFYAPNLASIPTAQVGVPGQPQPSQFQPSQPQPSHPQPSQPQLSQFQLQPLLFPLSQPHQFQFQPSHSASYPQYLHLQPPHPQNPYLPSYPQNAFPPPSYLLNPYNVQASYVQNSYPQPLYPQPSNTTQVPPPPPSRKRKAREDDELPSQGSAKVPRPHSEGPAQATTSARPRHPAPYKLEDGYYICTYVGPASKHPGVCGQKLNGKEARSRDRHLSTHAATEEDLISAGKINREDAVALDWVTRTVIRCDIPGCGYEISLWRTDGIRREHYLRFHPGAIIPRGRPRARVSNLNMVPLGVVAGQGESQELE